MKGFPCLPKRTLCHWLMTYLFIQQIFIHNIPGSWVHASLHWKHTRAGNPSDIKASFLLSSLWVNTFWWKTRTASDYIQAITWRVTGGSEVLIPFLNYLIYKWVPKTRIKVGQLSVCERWRSLCYEKFPDSISWHKVTLNLKTNYNKYVFLHLQG